MKHSRSSQGPLGRYRVIDLGHALAGPFAATMLADFGANVIKVERPGEGDAMREIGPKTEEGSIWWKSMARNKRSLALDWKNAAAKGVIEQLVRLSDVLVENYRPGVLERNGLGPDVLLGWNPKLIVLRISGYGQTGPYSERPGFGKAAEAISGVVHLSGFPEGPPVHPGFPLADMTTGLMGAYGVVLALLAVQAGEAKGQVIDLPIYETPLRLLDYHVPVRTGSSLIPTRNGNQQPMGFALSGVFQSKDGRWITYSAATFTVAQRVLNLIGGKQLLEDPRFTSLPAICRYDTEVNGHVALWMKERTATDILKAFGEAQAVAEIIYDTDAILSDPHIAARGNIASVPLESTKVVNVVPRLSETPGAIRWLGRKDIGHDTLDVLQNDLKFSEQEIAKLKASGAVG